MGRSTAAAGGRGRRPGGADTRGQILAVARDSFARKGFDRTTIRAVAADASVDPALVHHYFGSKDDLFLAALEIPIDPRDAIPAALAPGPDGAGERLLRTFLSVWDDPQARLPLLALARSALTTEAAADLLRSGMFRMIFQPVAALLGSDDAWLRAQLVASQLSGLVMTRYVLRLEPLASLPADEVVAWVAPNLQRYLSAAPPTG
ncbi:MAG: TetR family transcriptional regulator [Actinomycetota bacterium]|nr:TetR family transcriptional regulator [Actinomycetota bacterium]